MSILFNITGLKQIYTMRLESQKVYSEQLYHNFFGLYNT